MKTLRLNLTKAFLAIFGLIAAFGLVSQAEAQPVTLILTVNGGSSAQIVNGQSVALQWYIDGPVINCSINNGVGVIDTSNMPATGTLQYTPPANTNTNFVLNCDGTTSSASVAVAPTVTMTIDGGTSQTNDPITGRIDNVRVRWNSTLSTRCSNVWREDSSNPGVQIFANSNGDYSNKNQPSGFINYDGWPHGYISESATFYIACYNDVAGTSATGSITLNVTDPAPPGNPLISLWTNTPMVSTDPLYGYANADVRFDSWNTSWCNYNAYYADGSPYSDLPSGFGAWSGNTSRNFTSIQVATTTDFEVTCGRNAVTIGGVDYPATSTSDVVRVVVNPSGTTTDRSLLPPVTISATATPSTVVRDPIFGRGTTSVDLTVSNADYCYLRAFLLSNNVEYNLDGWTRTNSFNRLNGNGTYLLYLDNITQDTRLNIECLRQFDVDFYDPADPEYVQGYETVDVTILATSSPVAAPPPRVWIYGNGYHPTAADISATEISSTNFFINSGNDWYKTNNGTLSAPLYGEVTFPFDHPSDLTDVYDIYLRYCDENDGASNTFSVSVNGGPVLGTIVTDNPNAESNVCEESAEEVKRIASGVTLTEGDQVTVGCQNDDLSGGESCRLLQVYFGGGSGDGDTLAAVTSSSTGFANTPTFWYSENVAKCDANDSWATPLGDPSLAYLWKFGNWDLTGADPENELISTSTSFDTSCYRYADGLDATSVVTISLPEAFSLSASTSIATGQCIDPVTLVSTTAPPGYMADPVSGLCVAAVDLAAFSPSPNIGGAVTDNVFGTYDNLDAIIAIENLGPGEVVFGGEVSYMATVDPDPAQALPLISSPIGSYSSGIAAPSTMPGSTLSPTLTRTFNGVPFGTHQLCSRVNLDGTTNVPEWNTDVTNNTNCTSISLPVPPPPMSITADRIVVRPDQQALITWDINVAYQMGCTVNGPGSINESFNTLTTGYPYSDNQLTTPLTSTSEYIFSCTEPITNTTFTERVTVEVVPESQEI